MKANRGRRAFLRAIGAGLGALPFLNVVEHSYARAEGAPLPQRFIGVYHPHGIAAELFTMRASDTETAFDLNYEGCPLQPFDDAATYGRSFKDKIIAIEGIDLLSDTNGHNSAGTILTGSRIAGGAGGLPMNSSIDQFLAVKNGFGDSTLVTSVALGVGSKELSARQCLSFGEGGVPISKIIDPVLAFDFLFRQAVVGSDPAVLAAAERQRKLGKSLIDFVRGDVNRLRARVGDLEAQKLDQHLSALRSLEKKLAGLPRSNACTAPSRPSAFPNLEQFNGGEPYFDAISDAQIDLLGLAMGCDITRFATLVLNDLSYPGNPLGLPEDNHGGMAHTYATSQLDSSGQTVGGDPETWKPLAKFNRYCYGKVARLLQRLDEAGIVDSTLIYASSDMGNPAAHSTRNVPTLLAGGTNGSIRMGRRVKFPSDCPSTTACDVNGDDYHTMGNNRLLVSILGVFGIELSTYGNQAMPGLVAGTLSQL